MFLGLRSGAQLAGLIASADVRSSACRSLLCPDSLLTGNFTENFSKIVVSAHPETATSGAVTKQKSQIPYPPEQGIFSAKQGTVRQKQGRRLSSAGADRTRRKERFPARQA